MLPSQISENFVITGIGLQSPIGDSISAAVSALRRGVTAIAPAVLDDILPLLMGRVDGGPARDTVDSCVDFVLHASAQAVADSGIDVRFLDPWRCATVIGSSKGRLGYALGPGDVQSVADHFPGHTVGREVARHHGFCGPMLNYPTACATGLVSLIQAAHIIGHGDADIALTGSTEATGRALTMAGFLNMGALSTSPMKPYDIDRNGFNPGEGAAAFLLETESHATNRGAKPIAHLRGWDYRADAYHMTSADPSGKVVAYSIRRALQMAGWNPEDVEYINSHGTGTALNDHVEATAIAAVFGPGGPLVSSLKGYTGHLLGASSAVELALAISSVSAGFIPPTLGLTNPDPELQLNHVPAGGLEKQVTRLLKLSLGFGGHIAVAAVEVAPVG